MMSSEEVMASLAWLAKKSLLEITLTLIISAAVLQRSLNPSPRHHGRQVPASVCPLPGNVEPEQDRPINEDLRQHVHPNVSLIVRSVIGIDMASTGNLAGIDDAQGTRQIIDEHHDRQISCSACS